MRSAANSEAMTKCNVIATSACLQSQRQWLSAMPLQPLLFFNNPSYNEQMQCHCNLRFSRNPEALTKCYVNATCLFTNLEAMTLCNVIVTSTVIKKKNKLQSPHRSDRDSNVAPPFCQCNSLRS